jgi:two-component sensor histidine kinase
VDIGRAVPVALILNELLCNALTHAFQLGGTLDVEAGQGT